ncbi:MAG: hypothetical protein ACOC1O_04595 [bacterium]
MIIYSENYDNIIKLSNNFFSLEDKTKKRFEENVRKGTLASENIKEHLDNNFRVEKNLSLNEVEQLDESWQNFKYHFGEYCVDTGITYSEYLNGIRTNQKNISKISKDLKNFYRNKDTIFRTKSSISEIDYYLKSINDFRLPRQKLKLVVSFNISDMFMASTGQEWTSCLNLKSEYFGSYWYGLASLPFDKNRGMIYLAYQRDNLTSSFNIVSEKMYKRTFFLIDENNVFNILKWYPNSFETKKYIDLLNVSFYPFSFKEIDEFFTSKYEVDLPKINSEKNIEFYIYQDKTEIDYSRKKMFFTRKKGNQYFINGNSNFGQYINCEGGLIRIIEEQKSVKDFLLKTFICEMCENEFQTNEMRIASDIQMCNTCFHERTSYCEHCDKNVLSDEYHFEYGMCDNCFEEREEVL